MAAGTPAGCSGPSRALFFLLPRPQRDRAVTPPARTMPARRPALPPTQASLILSHCPFTAWAHPTNSSIALSADRVLGKIFRLIQFGHDMASASEAAPHSWVGT